MFRRTALLAASLALFAAPWAYSATDTVLLLHTNDIHDHVRIGDGGLGGMAYVSGYVKTVRAERDDVLFLDGGDVRHKGDLVAHMTDSMIVYEAMGRLGYDACAPGNHDIGDGLPHLKECAARAGVPILCVNAASEADQQCFPASKVFDVDGVKVGVIGASLVGGAGMLDPEATAAALEKEAQRLDAEAQLIVAVAHWTSANCKSISPSAPSVDVFVGGHSHERILEPMVVEETGALIVMAGDYAKYVGRLELTIDTDTEEITARSGGLVEMRHATTPCDMAMAAWITQREREVCPQAAKIIGRCEEPLGAVDTARLYAEAVRSKAQADIGICRGRMMLAGLPKGEVDGNAAFLALKYTEQPVVTASLTGSALLACIERAAGEGHPTLWSGCHAEIDKAKPEGQRVTATDIEPERTYRAALPKDAASLLSSAAAPETADCDFTMLDAFIAYAESVTNDGVSLDARAVQLAQTPALAASR